MTPIASSNIPIAANALPITLGIDNTRPYRVNWLEVSATGPASMANAVPCYVILEANGGASAVANSAVQNLMPSVSRSVRFRVKCPPSTDSYVTVASYNIAYFQAISGQMVPAGTSLSMKASVSYGRQTL